jgi:carbon monoxide dehydrogenase subunit G
MQQVFDRRIELGCPVNEVWATVTDIERLVSWISILHSARELEPLATYTATLEDRIGPFRLRADLDVRLSEVRPPLALTVRAEGEDRQVGSRIAVTSTLTLAETGQATTLSVTGRYEVTGKAASLGSSSIRKKGDTILNQFCDRAASELAAGGPPQSTAKPGES